MPDQRAKNKVMIGGYYEDNLKKELLAIANAEGKSLSELAEEIFIECVKNRKKKKK